MIDLCCVNKTDVLLALMESGDTRQDPVHMSDTVLIQPRGSGRADSAAAGVL